MRGLASPYEIELKLPKYALSGHAHGHLKLLRDVMEAIAVKLASKSGRTVVSIGGNFRNHHRNEKDRPNLWSINPIKCREDAAKQIGYQDMDRRCTHTIEQNCGCWKQLKSEEPEVNFTCVHAGYYLEPKKLVQLLSKHPTSFLYMVVHRFHGQSGKIFYDEKLQYTEGQWGRVAGNKIRMNVGQDRQFVHRDMKWLDSGAEYHCRGYTMVWKEEFNFDQSTYLYKFSVIERNKIDGDYVESVDVPEAYVNKGADMVSHPHLPGYCFLEDAHHLAIRMCSTGMTDEDLKRYNSWAGKYTRARNFPAPTIAHNNALLVDCGVQVAIETMIPIAHRYMKSDRREILSDLLNGYVPEPPRPLWRTRCYEATIGRVRDYLSTFCCCRIYRYLKFEQDDSDSDE
jgi:hypothetical protein